MPIARKKAKKVDRNDKWYLLAKEQGYRSRAAYKIAQINKEYGIMSGKTKVVLDLCAAPGGWSQIAAKCVASDAAIIAVDLLPIRPIPRVRCIVGDITTQQTREVVKREVKKAGHSQTGVDVVLCDGAPNVGAAYAKDAFVQNEISLLALKCGIDCGLRRSGSFCTKVYRSQDYNALLWCFGRLFEKVKAYKPAASRAQSAEIFVVCEGYLAPQKLDPKLLDPKFVFSEVMAPAKEGQASQVYSGERPLSVMHPNWGKKTRHREGYDDRNQSGLLALDVMTASELLKCEDAPQTLAERSKVIFEDGDGYKDHPATTAEVLACAEDLQVLSRGDFRLLLRWRDKVLKSEEQDDDDEEEEAEEKDDEEMSEVDSEDEMQTAIERAREKVATESRKSKKRAARISAKERTRRGLGIDVDTEATALHDEEVFSFSTAQRAGGLDALGLKTPTEEEEHQTEMGLLSNMPSSKKANVTLEYATEKERLAAIESQLDDAYEQYATRRLEKRNAPRDEKTKLSKKKRSAVASGIMQEDNLLLEGGVDDYVKTLHAEQSSDDEEDQSEEEEDENAASSRWFSRPIFDDVAPSAEKEQDIPMPKTEKEMRAEKRRKATERMERKSKRQRLRLGEEDFEGIRIEKKKKPDEEEAKKIELSDEAKLLIKAGLGTTTKDNSTAIEVVPREEEDSDEERLAPMRTYASDSDSDVDEKSRSLALATMMLRRSKAKQMIDASYNRFAWNDPKDLPGWFLEDEKRHYRPQMPIKPELVAEMKARFTELSNKPIKKVAEARARKSNLASKRLEAAKRKADALANDPELSSRQKLKAVQSTMAKGKKSTDAKQKIYVVSKKNGTTKNVKNKEATKGSRTVKVDARLKADKRATKAREKRGPKKKRQ